MTIDLHPLITPSFWLDLGPQPPSDAMSMALFILFAAVVLASAAVRFVRHKTADKLKRALLARVSDLLVTMGLVGLLLTFFLYEQIRFFGAHFWFLAWAAGLVAWIVAVVRFARVDMARMRGANAAQKERAKYLS